MFVKPLRPLCNMKHRVLISPADSKLIDKLSKYNIESVNTVPLDNLIEYERYHADMGVLRINDTFFTYECLREKYSFLKDNKVYYCKNPKKKYPGNVGLNAAYLGNKLICKESALCYELKSYCKNNSIEIVNVNQGYSKCSTLILNEKSIITADKSIAKVCERNGVEVLLITPGHIKLAENVHGFIGGASGVIGDTVYFFGNIKLHPNFHEIIEFIEKRKMKYISLTEDTLTDIGGFILLN